MAKIYVVRHGETSLNATNHLRGWMDVNLNENGIKQAYDLGQAFKDVPLSSVYSSDLKRAKDTASSIADGRHVQELRSLRPIDFGRWNGEAIEDIEPELKVLVRHWKTNQKAASPGGESLDSFQDRQMGFWRGILGNAQDFDKIAVVAHLRNMAWVVGFALNDMSPLTGDKIDLLNEEVQEPGTYSILDYDTKNNRLTVEGKNLREKIDPLED